MCVCEALVGCGLTRLWRLLSVVSGCVYSLWSVQISGRVSKKPAKTADADALQAFVITKQGGLQQEVLRLIDMFVQEYQSQ